MNDASTPGPPTESPSTGGEVSLVASARMWMSEALTAWAEDDSTKVAVLAPLAVEHLGKAALWRRNPVLLVPLVKEFERSLLELATAPNLTSPKLRTVGLAVLLGRLSAVLGDLPIDAPRRARMIDVRNGAVHVGSAEESRHVVLDALAVCNVLLDDLDEDKESFFGHHYSTALRLLDEKRTEVGHRVEAKLAKARRQLRELEQRLGAEMFGEMKWELESRAANELYPEDFGFDLFGVDAKCPECDSQGRLFGHVDAEPEVDVDVEPIGGGEYQSSPYMVGWDITFDPVAYACNVCRLTLRGADELAECQLPVRPYHIDDVDDLGNDFDPDELFASRHQR